ncbi:methylmalonyl-CoA mutase family protein [uncultured Williamsia sp.]|uniref:methylmalonyl-CoA mutase family protein n=1 Tax=uncultured Williamsia sp. TaxID=259311 RepID=UPI0026060165|nr:methylmalonyl-CoA mutase family protein [uncultured Williamsia sp.]
MQAARDAWDDAVAGVLAKARRTEPEQISRPAAAHLQTTTYDGTTIDPLYTRADELPEPPLPGGFPFVRGREATRDVMRGWHVTTRVGAPDADPADTNTAILEGLTTGTSALWLTPTTDPGDLPRILDGVLLDLAPLTLDAGRHVTATADALFALLDERAAAPAAGSAPPPDASTTRITLGVDTLTAQFAGVDSATHEEAVALTRAAVARPEEVRALVVDGTVFHDAGASDAQEIGAAIAAGLTYVRAGVENGLQVADVLDTIAFRFAATDQQFETIAKFRAARRVWARIAEVLGVPEHGDAPQHAVTSAAMMTQRDPWVNMLRTTLAAFGAGLGGADEVTVSPFDSALPPGALGVSRSFTDRMAVNTQLLLLEESHLGRVLDPAAGSWYVESLTDATAGAAWDVFTGIEAQGGYREALVSGALAATIGAVRDRRADDVAHRRHAITGVSEFPDVAEKPLPAPEPGAETRRVSRHAAPFETLRDRSDAHLAATSSRPAVLLAPLGSLAEYTPRTTFTINLLGAGGIVAVDPGPGADLSSAARETASPVAIVCGTDKRYADEAGDTVAALRAAGVTRILLAGTEKAVAHLEGDRRPDGFLSLGIDAVAALTDILDLLTTQGADTAGVPA